VINNAFYKLYLQTHYRSSVYFIGMMFGYGLYKRTDFPTSQLQRKVFWILSLIIIICSVFLPFFMRLLDVNLPLQFNAFLLATYRLNWVVAVCWIIFDCQRNPQGIVNKFLSGAFFKVISKLGYSIYLISPIVQYYVVSSNKHPIEIDFWTMCLNFITDLAKAFPAVVVVYLLIEEPFSQIGKIFADNMSNLSSSHARKEKLN
jgi:hypothetical protein